MPLSRAPRRIETLISANRRYKRPTFPPGPGHWSAMLDPYTRKLLSQYAFQQQHAAAANGYPHPPTAPPPMLGAPPDFPPSASPPGPPFPPPSGFPTLPPIPPPPPPPPHQPTSDSPRFPPFLPAGAGDRSPSPTAPATAGNLPVVRRRSPITGGSGNAKSSGFTIDNIIGNNNNKPCSDDDEADEDEVDPRRRRRLSRDRSRSPLARRSRSPPSPQVKSEVKEESTEGFARVSLMRRKYLHPDLVEADDIASAAAAAAAAEAAAAAAAEAAPPQQSSPRAPPTPPKNVISALYQSLQQQWTAP